MRNQIDFISVSGLSIGTSATTIATKNIVSGGIYVIEFSLKITPGASTTNTNMGITGPTATDMHLSWYRFAAAGSTFRNDLLTAMTDAAAGTAINATYIEGKGRLVASSATALNLRGIAVGQASTANGYFMCERIS